MVLPPTAIAKEDNNGTLCSKDPTKSQFLTLDWEEFEKNDTNVKLSRHIEVWFARDPKNS